MYNRETIANEFLVTSYLFFIVSLVELLYSCFCNEMSASISPLLLFLSLLFFVGYMLIKFWR